MKWMELITNICLAVAGLCGYLAFLRLCYQVNQIVEMMEEERGEKKKEEER